MSKNTFLSLSVILLFSGITATSVPADEIKMKDGTVHEGRITYEGDDIVKIEVAVSASIKETKILGRGDVAEIKKDAPDDVEFAKLEKLLPTQSLMSAGAYQTAIDTGPKAFLRSFPDSKHAETVKAMEKTLLEELDKVERGFIKIEDEWISPIDQKKFASQVESRVRLYKMKTLANSGNYNGFIAAMREFEALEQGYYGTPAFATAVELSLKVVPALGRQLQSMQRDADYRQSQYEQNKANLDEIAREQVEQARAREEQAYKAGLEIDKKAGLQWVRLNPNSKASITSYLEFAGKELKRLQEYDPKALASQAEKLVKVDQLVEDGNVERAEFLMKEALADTGQNVKKSSSKSKKAGSYIAVLSDKIKTKKSEIAAAAKAKEEAAKSEAITKRMEETKESPDLNVPKSGEGEKGESTTSKNVASDFAALSGANKKKDSDEEKAKEPKKKPSSKSESKEKREPVVTAPVEEGGGFPTGLIIPLISVLVLIGAVVWKVLSDKKNAAKEDAEEEEVEEDQE